MPNKKVATAKNRDARQLPLSQLPEETIHSVYYTLTHTHTLGVDFDSADEMQLSCISYLT